MLLFSQAGLVIAEENWATTCYATVPSEHLHAGTAAFRLHCNLTAGVRVTEH
jgi:hypothetical protein